MSTTRPCPWDPFLRVTSTTIILTGYPICGAASATPGEASRVSRRSWTRSDKAGSVRLTGIAGCLRMGSGYRRMGRTATIGGLELDALDGPQGDVHPQCWLQTLEGSLESVRLFPARQMDLEDHHVNWTVLRADHPGIQVRDVAALVRYHAGDGRYDSGTVCAVDREQEVRGL